MNNRALKFLLIQYIYVFSPSELRNLHYGPDRRKASNLKKMFAISLVRL